MGLSGSIKKVLIVSEQFGYDTPVGTGARKYAEHLSQLSNCTVDVVTSGSGHISGELIRIPRWLMSAFASRESKLHNRLVVYEDRFFSRIAGHPKAGSWGLRARHFVANRLK